MSAIYAIESEFIGVKNNYEAKSSSQIVIDNELEEVQDIDSTEIRNKEEISKGIDNSFYDIVDFFEKDDDILPKEFIQNNPAISALFHSLRNAFLDNEALNRLVLLPFFAFLYMLLFKRKVGGEKLSYIESLFLTFYTEGQLMFISVLFVFSDTNIFIEPVLDFLILTITLKQFFGKSLSKTIFLLLMTYALLFLVLLMLFVVLVVVIYLRTN